MHQPNSHLVSESRKTYRVLAIRRIVQRKKTLRDPVEHVDRLVCGVVVEGPASIALGTDSKLAGFQVD